MGSESKYNTRQLLRMECGPGSSDEGPLCDCLPPAWCRATHAKNLKTRKNSKYTRQIDLAARQGGDPFPLDHLPEVLRNLVQELAKIRKVPTLLSAAAGLSVTSASLGNSIRIESGGDRLTMGNLYILISADSGTGKSSALSSLLKPLRDEEDHLREFPNGLNGSPDGTGDPFSIAPDPADCPHAVIAPRGKGGARKKAPLPQLITDDVTGPALAEILSENKECTFNVTAEAGNLMDETRRASSPLNNILLKAYSGDLIDIQRKTSDPIRLNSPCITLLWLCQSHRLETFLSKDSLLEDGLIARMLVAKCDAPMAGFPEQNSRVCPKIEDAFGAVVSALRSYHKEGGVTVTVPCSTLAQNLIGDLHKQCAMLHGEYYKHLKSCVARWPEQVWRLALVLHAMQHRNNSHKEELAEETALAAIEITEWFIRQQLAIIGPKVGGPVNDRKARLEGLLRATPGQTITLRDLANSHGFKAGECERLAREFPDVFELEKRQNPKGGRPSKALILRPQPG